MSPTSKTIACCNWAWGDASRNGQRPAWSTSSESECGYRFQERRSSLTRHDVAHTVDELPTTRVAIVERPVVDGQTGYAKGMPGNRRISRVLDEHRFDALVASSAPKGDAASMLLDRDLRIRGLNATYEAVPMRSRKDMLGEYVFDVFPDDPDDPQASGPSQLVGSVEPRYAAKGRTPCRSCGTTSPIRRLRTRS